MSDACPFCGADRKSIPKPKRGIFFVKCKVCGATGPRADDAERARTLWTDRSTKRTV